MKTKKTQDLLASAEKKLKTSKQGNERLESELLLCFVLKCERIDLYKKKYDFLDDKEAETFGVLIERRIKTEPIAHIIQQKEFFGLSFKVSPETLIPRPETELLVEEVSDFYEKDVSKTDLIDLGTGSGCIALSLAKQHPELKITAVDKSKKALLVAQKNAQNLNLDKKNLFFLEDDILKENFWEKEHKFDIIVSNPPYIGFKEKSSLSKEVLSYEPKSALFAKEEGLEFYKMFANHGRKILKPSGRLFLELSPIIYEDVCKIFITHGWSILKTVKDYAGHKRHIILSS